MQSNQKPLIDDDIILREIARCPEPEWPRTRKIMLRFFTIKNGEWHHKRIDSEIEKSLDICATKSKAGKAGAEKRWQKDSIGNASANGRRYAGAMAKRCRQMDSPVDTRLPL